MRVYLNNQHCKVFRHDGLASLGNMMETLSSMGYRVCVDNEGPGSLDVTVSIGGHTNIELCRGQYLVCIHGNFFRLPYVEYHKAFSEELEDSDAPANPAVSAKQDFDQEKFENMQSDMADFKRISLCRS